MFAKGTLAPCRATVRPVSHFGPAFVSPVPPAAPVRVVYRDPVASPTYRSSSVRRTSAPTDSRSSAPVYRRSSDDPAAAPQTRSWKKSAIIIGGSTAAGAGVGAILDGKSGAKKGAVVGLLGGTIYDIATRTKH